MSRKKAKSKFQRDAHLNKPLKITIYTDKYKITKTGKIISKAININTTKETIINKISQLGDTPFILNKIDINMDNNIFIQINELKSLRRSLINELIDQKTKVNRTIPKIKYQINRKMIKNKININVSVETNEQLEAVIDKVDTIYTNNIKLAQKYPNIYLKLDRTLYHNENYKNRNLLLGNLGQVYKYFKSNNCNADYFLNITNSYSVNFFNSHNLIPTISPELSINQILNIAKTTNNFEVIVYGRLELMIINYNILKDQQTGKYSLKNIKNEMFPIIIKNNKTHILHHTPINLINEIKTLKNSKISTIRLEFTDETKEETKRIIDKVKSIIN
ncbi:MAG: DUF3656 domain-containing protein [Bacilli bacterium]|nr:DUF3656 domain-containing protein [Bacilli bacterium]